jgi:hypothetical protein
MAYSSSKKKKKDAPELTVHGWADRSMVRGGRSQLSAKSPLVQVCVPGRVSGGLAFECYPEACLSRGIGVFVLVIAYSSSGMTTLRVLPSPELLKM